MCNDLIMYMYDMIISLEIIQSGFYKRKLRASCRFIYHVLLVSNEMLKAKS